MKLITYPNKLLKQKSAIVMPDEDNGELISGMLLLMRDLKGIGFAANQVGVMKQIFVFGNEVFQNAQILFRSEERDIMIEGCLSFPERKVRTKRAREIDVAYYDRNFNEVTKTLSGLNAVIFQHEHDHTMGKTMLDREYNRRD